MALQKGDKAPAFKLPNSEEKEVSLGDFKGKNLIILFYPAAFTSVCTTELCSMRDTIADYTKTNADVVAISVDSPATLEKFKQAYNLPFNLLSDSTKEVSAAYGSLYGTGVSMRSAFVVDKEGNIQHAEVLASANDLPNFEAVQQTLASLS
jgi:peroxiredoxin